ncbi:MAG: leucine-rich repeat domain-containing protein [Paludibacter sp.]|nr:leucine-rich repeat domain-containing protein [Paludibacter sp.]
MRTLRFTLILSILLFAFCAMINAKKHFFAEESIESGLRNFNKYEQSPPKVKKRVANRDSDVHFVKTMKKEDILKIAEQVIQSEEKMILYANYYFDSNGLLTKRIKYTYDGKDNLVEYSQEILNDNSRYWMQWAGKWIVSNNYTQVYDSRNNIIEYKEWELDYENGEMNLTQNYTQQFDDMNRKVYYESYIWDNNYHRLIGNEKYFKRFNSEGYQVYTESYYWNTDRMDWIGNNKELSEVDSYGSITNYEYYEWNNDLWDWTGSDKYTSTYTIDGVNIQEEQFHWVWDQGAKSWIKNLSYKNEYSYQIINEEYWYTVRSAYYELINNEYLLTDETTRVPYPQGNSYLSTLRKVRINDVLTDYTKTEYQYNNNNKWSQVLFYVWMSDQWQNSEYRVFEYSTPDSVRTQINKRTPVYYQFNGLALPTLCQGETLYPTAKYVTKYHPVSGAEECYYAYRWDYGMCNWVPNSPKRMVVYDALGIKQLSYTECSQYDQYNWFDCYNRQTIYNEAGKITEKSESRDGVQIYKYTNVYDNAGNRIAYSYFEGDSLLYSYNIDYNVKGNIVRQVYDFVNWSLPLHKERRKWEVEYIADTLISVVKIYNGSDLNADGVLGNDEWQYEGKSVYKYDAPLSGDSVHIVTQAFGDLGMIDFGTVKKLKITGPVTNGDLAALNEFYQDSLRVLDLETAEIEDNTLKSETFDETSLYVLILPNTLVSIEEGAISDYNGYLKYLVIYPSVENFEYGAIEATGLRGVELKSAILERLYSFMDEEMNVPGIVNVYKSALQEITFNDPQGKLPNEICYNLAYLKKVVIKDGITEIGDNAFKSCGMLNSVKLPSTLTKIGYNAFWGCNELTELTIPEGTAEVGYSAFWGCSGLSTIEMPSSLLNIGKNAFWGCSNVEQLKVAAVEPPALGDNALAGVPRDASLTIPSISVEKYKVKDQWKEFYNINTGTDENFIRSLNVVVSGRKLLLSDFPENSTLQLYNVSGLKIIDMVNPDQHVSIDLEPGVYVVKVGNDVCKIVIR